MAALERAVAFEEVNGALAVATESGSTGLADPAQFVGYRGDAGAPSAVLLVHNGLHLEIVIDRDHPIGKDDGAGVADPEAIRDKTRGHARRHRDAGRARGRGRA